MPTLRAVDIILTYFQLSCFHLKHIMIYFFGALFMFDVFLRELTAG